MRFQGRTSSVTFKRKTSWDQNLFGQFIIKQLPNWSNFSARFFLGFSHPCSYPITSFLKPWIVPHFHARSYGIPFVYFLRYNLYIWDLSHSYNMYLVQYLESGLCVCGVCIYIFLCTVILIGFFGVEDKEASYKLCRLSDWHVDSVWKIIPICSKKGKE